jgi:hypothetical protein
VQYRTPLLILFLSLAFGCASLSSPAPGNVVKGPGSVFPTAEAAAVDGLAWCVRDARRDDATARLRIGVVRQLDDGYTYDTPGVASWAAPRNLEYVLKSDSVAHFQYYSADQAGGRSQVYEHHSKRQRRVVDEIDPLHRTSYLLTPSLRVVAYRGHGEEPEVAQLQRPGWKLGEVLAAR